MKSSGVPSAYCICSLTLQFDFCKRFKSDEADLTVHPKFFQEEDKDLKHKVFKLCCTVTQSNVVNGGSGNKSNRQQLFYNLNLQSIAVGGKIVDIDPAVFALKNGIGGTAVDSGTALSVLAEKAYDPFMHSLTTAVYNLHSLSLLRETCVFRCPADLVLGDKIIVYDLAHQRLGWDDHDCPEPVSVSTAGNDCVNIQHRSSGSSTVTSVLASTATFLVYISMFGH